MTAKPDTPEPGFDVRSIEGLRCPEVISRGETDDRAGRLELAHDCWLVSAESGFKYPIVEGIPVLLIGLLEGLAVV